LEDEYGEPLTAEAFETVWVEIEQALRGLLANKHLLDLLHGATRLIPQRPIMFKHDESIAPSLSQGYAVPPSPWRFLSRGKRDLGHIQRCHPEDKNSQQASDYCTADHSISNWGKTFSLTVSDKHLTRF
jgi:hypothetical protein